MKECNNNLRGKSVDYKTQLRKSVNLIRYSPVLNHGYSLKHAFPTSTDNKSWGGAIGLKIFPNGNFPVIKKNLHKDKSVDG